MAREQRKKHHDDYYGADDPALIQKCLECRKPSCNNCIEWLSKAERALLREAKRKGEVDGD
jgi:hypothetical protein